MKQIMTLAIVAIVASVAAPMFFENYKNKPDVERHGDESKASHVSVVQEEPGKKNGRKIENPYEGRKEVLRAASNGHFYTKARLNRIPVEVLVDTGATMVALDEDTARRLGITLKQSDFKYKTSTANGVTRAAYAMLDEVAIGRVVVKDVKVVVLQRGKLNIALLGMSFLNQLKSFGVADGELILKQ